MKRHSLGSRTHRVFFTDEDLIEVGKEWLRVTECPDSPSVLDLIIFRTKLQKRTGADLDMVCLNWLRNEIVSLRKKGSFKETIGV